VVNQGNTNPYCDTIQTTTDQGWGKERIDPGEQAENQDSGETGYKHAQKCSDTEWENQAYMGWANLGIDIEVDVIMAE